MVHGSKTQQFLKALACIQMKVVTKLCHSAVKILSGFTTLHEIGKLLGAKMANVSNSD